MTIATLAAELNVSPFRIIQYLMAREEFRHTGEGIPGHIEDAIRKASDGWPKKGSLDMGVNRCKEYL